MTILQNAIDSIAIGLEDFESADNRRIISSTRNIFAGILLLFKHKLSELSPADSDEALIKQKVIPCIAGDGPVKWVGKGHKTVDFNTIEERFKSLGITVDWERMKKINRYRNDIEHYYSTLNNGSVQQLISDSFLIIRDFVSDELDEDPKILLGDKSWEILVNVNEVYAKEKLECEITLESLEYLSNDILSAINNSRCDECGSGLIESTMDGGDASDASFRCRTCGKETGYSEIANAAVSDFYAVEVYLSHKDGGETPVVDCPYCFEGAYLVHDSVCVLCGNSASHECTRCGGTIPPEELSDDSVCGYCQHMWAKVMAE